MIKHIITRGYGSFGSVGYLITRGLGSYDRPVTVAPHTRTLARRRTIKRSNPRR